MLAKRRKDGSYEDWPNSTAYAVLALRSAGIADVADSVGWLREVQNEDGGWGNTAGSPSDPDGTGAVLQTLDPVLEGGAAGGRLSAPDPAAGRRLAARRQRRVEHRSRPPGRSRGCSPRAPTRPTSGAGGESAYEYLEANQAGDGHYRYSSQSDQSPVWVTSEVLVAAAKQHLPLGARPTGAAAEEDALAFADSGPDPDAGTAAHSCPGSGRGDAVADAGIAGPSRAGASRSKSHHGAKGGKGKSDRKGKKARPGGLGSGTGAGTPPAEPPPAEAGGGRIPEEAEPGEGEGGESSVDNAAPVESKSGSGSDGVRHRLDHRRPRHRRPALRARIRPLSPPAGDAVEESASARRHLRPPDPRARRAGCRRYPSSYGPRQGKPSGPDGAAGGGPAMLSRAAAIESIAGAHFEVVVIGGGITGAGVALDAASRGCSVALLERDDYAIGTSSRSSKMVHGGLRYLQYFDLGLVREALLERQLLVQPGARTSSTRPRSWSPRSARSGATASSGSD